MMYLSVCYGIYKQFFVLTQPLFKDLLTAKTFKTMSFSWLMTLCGECREKYEREERKMENIAEERFWLVLGSTDAKIQMLCLSYLAE
jgi:hypothetical protein